MAVTSEQLFKFVDKATTVDIKLDKDGEEVFRTEAVLFGDSLATALRAVTDLAAHETGLGFAQQQWEHQHPTTPTYSGPRAVN